MSRAAPHQPSAPSVAILRIPSTGKIGRAEANGRSNRIGVQNTGAEKPTSDNTVIAWLSAPAGRRDAATPSKVPAITAPTIAVPTSSNVAGTRVAISPATGALK